MGVLGGFKNMLRTWKNNLKRKKKEKNKKKSFLYSFLAIIIYPVYVIFNKNDKIVSKLNKSNDKNSKKLETKVKNSSSKDQEKKYTIKSNNIINENLKNVKITLSNNLINKKENENNKNSKTIESTYKKSQEKEYTIKSINIIDENLKIILSNNFNKKENEKNKNSKTIKMANKKLQDKNYKSKFKDDNNKNLEKKSNTRIILSNNSADKKCNIKKLMFDNEINKDFVTKLIKTTNEVDKLKKYNESYQISYKIKELEEKIGLLKKEFEENNLLFEDDLSIDDIIKLEEDIKKLSKKLEQKKKEILNYKKVQNDVKKENSKEKKQKEIQVKKELTEFELCNKIVIENINKCNKLYNDYLKEIKRKNKKNTLFRHINMISNSVLGFILGLFPFKSIKNFFLKDYIIALNINNSIRLMNRIINPLDTNNYYILLNEFNDIKEVIENTYVVMNDSLERISKIKEDLIDLKVYEIDSELYNKILNIEKLINKNIKQMEMKHNELNKAYVKIKNNV